MASVEWIGSSGDWSTAADWSTGTVPAAGDDVTLSGYFTVTLSSGATIGSLDIQNFGANLQIAAPGQKIVVQQNIDNGGAISLDASGAGGTKMVVDGTFTNSGTFAIGPTFGVLPASTTVAVSHLVNGGTLMLDGGADGTAALAWFDDMRDNAPATLATGSLSLQGNALLEFAGGKIDAIGEAASISLTGDEARIADAGETGSSSALTRLTANAGGFSLADGASASDTTGDFDNSGRFNLSGGSTFSTGAGLDLINSGALSIDQYESTGGSVLTVGGTLHNTGYLAVGGYGAAPVVTVSNFDNSGSLEIEGTQNGTPPVVFNVTSGDAPTTLVSGSSLSLFDDAVLTFAAGEITTVAAGATLILSSAAAQINDAGASGQNSALTQFAENDGTVMLSAGATLPVLANGFLNTGTFTVTNGTSVSARAGFTNTGTLNVEGNFTQQSTSFVIKGTLTNTGILNIGAGEYSSYSPTPPTSVIVDKLTTGTVYLAGSAVGLNGLAELIVKEQAAPGVLTKGAVFDLTGDALVQYAGGSIKMIASGAEISLDGIQARIADSANPTTSSALTILGRNAGTLKLADGANLGNSAIAFTNTGLYAIAQGTAVSTAAGVNFTNNGTFTLDTAGQQGGSSLAVGGTLTNTGTITIGMDQGLGNAFNLAGTSEVIAAHLQNTGTINLFSSENSPNVAFLNDTGDAAASILQNQSLNLVGNALLEYGSGGIQTIARGAQITLDGSQAFIAVAAKPAFNSALTGLTSNAGTLSLADGATIAKTIASFDNSGRFSLLHQEALHVSGDFQNSGIFAVDHGALAYGGEGQSVVIIDGTLNNAGSLLVGDETFALTGDTTVDVAHLVNTKTIDIASTQEDQFDPVPYQAAVIDLKDSAPQILAAGTIELDGNALLQYARGGIAQISQGATLSLTGAQARIADSADTTTSSALTTLTSNAGTLKLDSGALVSNGTNDFANSGTLSVGFHSGDADTLFTIGGALTNSGTIDIANPHGATNAAQVIAQSATNSGVIKATGGEAGLHIIGTFVNTGKVDLGANGSYGGFIDTDELIQKSGQIELHNSVLQTLTQDVFAVRGGVLEGSGEVEANLTVTGGTFGQAGTGTLSVEGGALTIDAGGTLEATLAGDNFVPLRADAFVNLNGGTLSLHAADATTFTKGESFTVLDGLEGLLKGTFDKIEYDGVIATGNTIAIGNGLALKVKYNEKMTGDIDVMVVADHSAQQTAAPAASAVMAVAPDGTVVHHIADDLILHHGGMQHDGLALV